MMEFTKIVEVVKEKGGDLVGYANVSSFAGDQYDKGNPRYYLSNAENVIVIGLKINDALWDNISGRYDDVNNHNSSSYLLNYNYVMLDYIAIQLARFIEELGYDCYPVQARTFTKRNNVLDGFFSFKNAAVLAGLGNYGKNSLVITPQFGPRVRFVSVITDLPIEANNNNNVIKNTIDDVCEECNICIDACPVGALSYKNGIVSINKSACQGYMDQARLCTLCQAICPKGKEAANQRRKRKGIIQNSER